MIEAAGTIVEDINGKVLVLQRKDKVPEENLLGLPGGKVSPSQDPAEAALIKMESETGFKFEAIDLKKLNVFSYIVDKNEVIFHVFVVRIQKIEPEIKLNTDGHRGYFWVEPKSLILRSDMMKGMYPIFEFYNKSTG